MKTLIIAALLLTATPNNPFYKDKKVPGSGDTVSCCQDKDCRPVASWRIVNGKYQIHMLGKWHTPPQYLVVETPTPDANAHVCYKPGPAKGINWFCIFIPVGLV